MEALAQTSSGSAEARAVKARRGGEARDGRRRRPRRKVVARRVEEEAVVVAVAQVVVRRRTAMTRSSRLVPGGRRRRAVGREVEAEGGLISAGVIRALPSDSGASPSPEASRRAFSVQGVKYLEPTRPSWCYTHELDTHKFTKSTPASH